MTGIANYIEYFRNVAVTHPLIGHNPLSEVANGPAGERGFTLFTAEEVLKQLRFSLNPKKASLHLNIYESSFKIREINSQRDSYFTGAFMITKKMIGREMSEIADIFIETEGIAEDVLSGLIDNSIWGDECAVDYVIEAGDVNPLGPIWDNRYGWLVEFNFFKK